MGSFSKMPVMPLPPYALQVLMHLAQQPPSSKPFKRCLVKALRRLMKHCFGAHMTPEQFSLIFTKELIESYVETMGMDVVAFAKRIMQQEGKEDLLVLGEWPLTWTDAIAEGLRHMSWLMYSTYMSRAEFEQRYPPELFVLFTEFNGLDKLQ
jgi:hypothetical protein